MLAVLDARIHGINPAKEVKVYVTRKSSRLQDKKIRPASEEPDRLRIE
jgi:hypothetical protein